MHRTLDRLTRQEWNAAYCLGLRRVFQEAEASNVTTQILVGLEELRDAGYRFELQETDSTGRPPSCARTGEHEDACRQILDGTFDQIERTREAVTWLECRFSEEKTAWLRRLLALYDRTHPETPAAGAAFYVVSPSGVEAGSPLG